MLKLQQFFQFKISSDRLKKSNYNIATLTLDQARKNLEVISINSSELLRALFRIKRINFSQRELDKLFSDRKKIRRLPDSPDNRNTLAELNQKIESILFVEDLVSIVFTNKAHYKQIAKRNGFYINGIRYVSFMASAGMIRRNTALFINNNYKYQLVSLLENGRDGNVELVSAKWGAYFSLYSSSTLPVSFPRIAIISDKTMKVTRHVDFVEYRGVGIDDDVTEKDYEFEANCFDGQGLISPQLANKWSGELDLDYTFSEAVIRGPFLKGLAVVFDFVRFAKEIAGTYEFIDIYGDVQDIREIDLLVSESQFKLWASYQNTGEYTRSCQKNELGFGISKVNPEKERSYSRTSYQFLQVLNLNDVDIARLCEPSIRWFREVSGGSADSMILYAIGEGKLKPDDFEKADVTTKAILLNPALARDRYIQERFIKTLEKKKKESFMGSILIQANYQLMIADPFFQCCHVFGLANAPLLKDGEHYSEYWQNRGISKIAAIRSPIVHHSEVNILNLQERPDTREWYSFIHSGIIFPTNGIGMDCAIHGGADFDGDLVCTINSPEIIKGKRPGLPIMYESSKAQKEKVDAGDDGKQIENQLRGFNSKVGYATNVSSSLYTLLAEFPKGSREYETIEKRLKIGRVIQGEIIDSVKGLHSPPFREHWTKYQKPSAEFPNLDFYNQIVCSIRPAFFRFLYSHYMTRWNKELRKYTTFCRIAFGKEFTDILNSSAPSRDELETIKSYKKNSFFLDNDSLMNKISRYMRTNLALTNRYSAQESRGFDYSVLLGGFEQDDEKLNSMLSLLQQYKSFKRGLWKDNENYFDSLDAFIAYLRKRAFEIISSDEKELAHYAVLITYAKEKSMVEFAWKLFPDGVFENIKNNSGKNSFFMPVEESTGKVEYLWQNYAIREYTLGDPIEQPQKEILI